MKAILTRQHLAALILGMAAAISACGSDTTDPGGNSNQNGASSCTVTLSGAQTGSPACSKVSAVWTSNDNKGSFGLSAAGGSDTVNVAIGFAGEPRATIYTSGTGASAVMLVLGGTGAWENSPAASWSLTLSSVSTTNSGAGLKGYQVHGTLTATLLSIVGTSTAPVTVTATF